MATSSKTNDGRDAAMQVAAAVVSPQAEKPVVSPNLLVAAIDFGTAYSGYAYLSRENFDKDPLSISAPEWDKDLKSPKTPTSILFDKDQKIIAFGNEAEKRFTELSEDENHEEFYFFQKFKMLLYNSVIKQDEHLTKQTELSDIKGKKMRAIDVFSAAIKYLKDHLLNELKNRGMDGKVEDIRWVLTVPAIWDDLAKQFMRDAAEQADIQKECLIIALEPEAASIFCKHLPMNQKTTFGNNEIQKFDPGSRYLVMDAGGGTVDVTIHEILNDGQIKELHHATGGAWGGTYVDEKFHEMLKDILGKNESGLYVFDTYKREFLADYLEIRQTLEIGKRNFSTASRQFEFKLPPSLKKICRDAQKCRLEELIMQSDYKDSVKCKKEKLYLDVELMKNLFYFVCNGIVNHVKNLLDEENINTVLMVGGFSESPFLQETMKTSLPKCQIVIPNEAGLAVLKGAVLFGHEPKAIVSRIAKYSYGVDTHTRFIHDKHPSERLEKIDGKEYCTGVFSKHITKGDTLKIDEAQDSQTYSPVLEDQTAIQFKVYTSTNKKPKYVDDEDCHYLASLTVDMPDTTGGTDRKVNVKFMFGQTEIKVEAKNEQTDEVEEIQFDYFEKGQDDDRQYAMQE